MLIKSFNHRVKDLKDHAELLMEACERFLKEGKLNEIRNIASRLRVLAGKGRGNGLLFDLAQDVRLDVLILDMRVELTLTETAPDGTVLQTITKRKLVTNPFPGQPTLPVITLNQAFRPWLKEMDIREWLKDGYLMDWEAPAVAGKAASLITLTPQKLIHAYADKEAAHADREYCEELRAPFETMVENYTMGGRKMNIPVIYNYLYQIGRVVSLLSTNFLTARE